ncbi:MAG: dihydrolipoyllysine-residue succinyltransferase, partial [Deltaproteobacteria bacterium]|nr:dihydrolipoyllysine-residue succinyltransferase [Deltaproteobacteria bacterium]
PVASPASRAILAEHRLDPAAVPGTGKGGRITREDAVAAVAAAIPAAPGAPAAPEAPAETAAAPALQTRRPMSPLRQRIAERLVLAQQTAAMLTTFNEVDLSALDALRKRVQERFTAAHGVKLGYMSFFVKAVAAALRTVPDLGARLEGGEIVADNTFDIGVAVSTERGLVVPVLRAVHRKGFGELERDMAGLAEQARTGRLTLDQLAGGVFTISNGGVFGSLLSTPILNHPQTGILGMHAIKRRPVAVGEEVVIRPMMYLALSYDHRVVDGREAVTFLKRIVTCLEDPEPMLMEACDGRG